MKEGEKQESCWPPALARRVAGNLGLSVEEVMCLPFVPVVVGASVDADPGPYYNPSNEESSPFETRFLFLDVARDGDGEVLVPQGVPIDEIWVDFCSAAATGGAELLFGSRNAMMTIQSGNASGRMNAIKFRTPYRGGVKLTNIANAANSFCRISIEYGRTASSKGK